MIVYLENIPLSRVTGGSGLSKAILPLLSAMNHQVDGYVIKYLESEVALYQIDSMCQKKLSHLSRVGFIERKLWRFGQFFSINTTVWLQGVIDRVLRRSLRLQQGSIIFAAVGVDPGAFFRAYALAKEFDCRLYIYFVDDIEAHPVNKNNWFVSKLMRELLVNVDLVFVITESLGECFHRRYGVDFRYLPLISDTNIQPLHQDPPCSIKYEEFFGVYLGGVNHLYSVGLIDLINAMKQSVAETETRKFCFLSPLVSVSRIFDGKIPDFVEVKEGLSDYDVGQVIRRAKFAFLPYSFDINIRQMVSTSFPSKSLTYLINAKNILIYAPSYSSAVNLFGKYELKYIATSFESLLQCVEYLSIEEDDQTDLFRAIVAKEFSPELIKKIIDDVV